MADDAYVEVTPDWIAQACDRAHSSPRAAEVGHRSGFCLACAEIRAAVGGVAAGPQATPDPPTIREQIQNLALLTEAGDAVAEARREIGELMQATPDQEGE